MIYGGLLLKRILIMLHSFKHLKIDIRYHRMFAIENEHNEVFILYLLGTHKRISFCWKIVWSVF